MGSFVKTSASDAPTSPAAAAPATAATAADDLSAAAAQALARMRKINPNADPQTILPDVPLDRIPRHIAFIMDGNGRWANERQLSRFHGHQAGAEAIRTTIEECGRLGVEVITLYSFSSENWKRPPDEVAALMRLSLQFLQSERQLLIDNNIRFVPIGRREGLPVEVLAEMDATVHATRSCAGPTLCVAMNYGGRTEIVDAARAIARDVVDGLLDPDSIDESVFESSLYTAGLPEPDLLVRTSGEMRLSNFLLWQISYAEIHVTDTHWPDFGAEAIHAAIRDYAQRNRRFGDVTPA